MSLIHIEKALALRGECRHKRAIKAHSMRSPSPRPSRHTQKAVFRKAKRPLVSKIDIAQSADIRHTVEYWEIGRLFTESVSPRDSQAESQLQITVPLDILHFADEGLDMHQRQGLQQLAADSQEFEPSGNGEGSSALAVQLAFSIRVELDAVAAAAGRQLSTSHVPADMHQALANFFEASKSLATRQDQLVQMLKASQKGADGNSKHSSSSSSLRFKSGGGSSSCSIITDLSKSDSPGSSQLHLGSSSRLHSATALHAATVAPPQPTASVLGLSSAPLLAQATVPYSPPVVTVNPVTPPAPAAALSTPASTTPRVQPNPKPATLPQLPAVPGNHAKAAGIKAVHLGSALSKAKAHREMEDRLFMATMDPTASMQQKQLSSGALSLIIQQQKDAAAVSLGAAIAGVFDGHGGGLTAQHAATFIPELVAGGLSGQGVRPVVPGAPSLPAGPPINTAEAFDRALTVFDDWWRRASETDEWTNHHGHTSSGSTAVLALVKERQLTVANVGDSVAVLARGGEALRLSHSHHAGRDVEETQRVLLAGGLVASAKPGGPPRVWKSGFKYGHAGLMMTRSLGDFSFKWPQPLVISTPHSRTEELQSDDQLVLLVSDGVTDVLTDSAMVEVALAALNQGRADGSGGHQLAQAVASAVVEDAKQRGSKDDITAVSMVLDWE